MDYARQKSVVVFLTIIIPLVTQSECVDFTMSYNKTSICNIDQRIQEGCSRDVPYSRSLFDCMNQCQATGDRCFGVSFDPSGPQCIHHGGCSPSVECASSDTRHDYWERYCVLGEWNRATSSCDCLQLSDGQRCDRFPKECPNKFGYFLATIDPDEDNANPLEVGCFRDSIIIGVNFGELDTNRTWDEYVNGFIQDRKNLWVGLKTIRALTQANYVKLQIDIAFKRYPQDRINRRYNSFTVQDESQGYSFSYTGTNQGSSGNYPAGSYFGDCLTPQQNVPFSTWDRDRDDEAGENCARSSGSGWWYSGCQPSCNLLGWGLDDWEATPNQSRLKVEGLDVQAHASIIKHMIMYLLS